MKSSGYGNYSNNWNSCGNGHVYYIDGCRALNFVSKNHNMKIRCGGPLQQRSFPEHGCDQMIGGTRERLNTTNR